MFSLASLSASQPQKRLFPEYIRRFDCKQEVADALDKIPAEKISRDDATKSGADFLRGELKSIVINPTALSQGSGLQIMLANSRDDIRGNPYSRFERFARDGPAEHEEESLDDEPLMPDVPESYIHNLSEMGFPSDRCRRALLYTHLNLESAAELLLTGDERLEREPTNSELIRLYGRKHGSIRVCRPSNFHPVREPEPEPVPEMFSSRSPPEEFGDIPSALFRSFLRSEGGPNRREPFDIRAPPFIPRPQRDHEVHWEMDDDRHSRPRFQSRLNRRLGLRAQPHESDEERRERALRRLAGDEHDEHDESNDSNDSNGFALPDFGGDDDDETEVMDEEAVRRFLGLSNAHPMGPDDHSGEEGGGGEEEEEEEEEEEGEEGSGSGSGSGSDDDDDNNDDMF